jgi:hypothetical protein
MLLVLLVLQFAEDPIRVQELWQLGMAIMYH